MLSLLYPARARLLSHGLRTDENADFLIPSAAFSREVRSYLIELLPGDGTLYSPLGGTLLSLHDGRALIRGKLTVQLFWLTANGTPLAHWPGEFLPLVEPGTRLCAGQVIGYLHGPQALSGNGQLRLGVWIAIPVGYRLCLHPRPGAPRRGEAGATLLTLKKRRLSSVEAPRKNYL